MRNRIVSAALALVLLLCLTVPVLGAANPAVVVSPQAVYFDGELSPISAYNIDGYNYFKLRDVAQLLAGSPVGFSIDFDTANYTILITTGGDYESRGGELEGLAEAFDSIAPSVWKLTVDGAYYDVGAYNIDGSNYFKLADLGYAVGFTVFYDEATKSVQITSVVPFRYQPPESDPVDPSWFDDAAFVGDSVSMYLTWYAGSAGLGDATFLTAGSFSLVNALSPISPNTVHPTYQGMPVTVEDGIVMSGAKKVFILLGMNDLSYGVDISVERYQTLIQRIYQQAPDVQIFIQSTTPMTKTSPSYTSVLNNTVISQFNDRMKELCQENGWYYLDVASVLTDSEGYLRDDYCSDPAGSGPNAMGMHLLLPAMDAWVNYLRTHIPPELKG